MSIVDIIIIIMLVFFTYFGARRGLVDELLGLTGWILAFLVALGLCDYPARLIHDQVPKLGIFSTLISIVLILLLSRVFIQVIANGLNNSMGKNKKSFGNTFGGSILGFIQGLFFLSVIILTITVFPFNQSIKGIEKGSVLYSHVQVFSVYVVKTIAKYIPNTETAVNKVVQKVESSQNEKNKTQSNESGTADQSKLTPEEIEKAIQDELKEARQSIDDLRR
jgi:uncharacterized membrane protein required for colicin V production